MMGSHCILSVEETIFPMAEIFTISRGSRTETRVVTVSLEQDGLVGRGESVPYGRYDETVEGVIADIRSMSDTMASGMTRQALQDLPAMLWTAPCGIWNPNKAANASLNWRVLPLRSPCRRLLPFRSPHLKQCAAKRSSMRIARFSR